MTLDSYEKSVASGKPIEFYDFIDDFGNHSRINTTPNEIVYASHTYYPEPCQRSALKIGDAKKKISMTFNLSPNNAFANQYLSGPLEGKATVTCFGKHLDDSEIRQFWFGRITGVKFKNGVPTITAEPRTSSVSRAGRRRRCQRLCDHDLFDAYCGLSKESWKVTGTVDSVSGLVVTSTTFGTKPDDWFAFGGELVVGNAHRMIEAHTGNDVTITRTIPGLSAGDSFIAYAGCAHDPDACNDKNNKINYGGDEFLPKKDPHQDGLQLNRDRFFISGLGAKIYF